MLYLFLYDLRMCIYFIFKPIFYFMFDLPFTILHGNFKFTIFHALKSASETEKSTKS